jgi:formate dehydrogenase major subunit
MPVQLKIDGSDVTALEGATIWEAARDAGIDVPILCHQENMRPVGVCRMCVVDVGQRVMAASCVRTVEEGMNVKTQSDRLTRYRRTLVELLLADYPRAEQGRSRQETTDDDELLALAEQLSAQPNRFPSANGRSKDDSSPVIAVDHQACILCDRCVRACDEIQSNEVITRTGKGRDARIAFDLDQPMGESTCVSCGECAASCPTGALTNKPISAPIQPRPELKAVDTVCPYCGVGCSVRYHVDTDVNRIAFADGRESPVNHGRLCVKGRYGFDYTTHHQRLTSPLIRRPEFYPKGPLSGDVKGDGRGRRKPGGLVAYEEVMPAFREASWDEALDLTAQRLKEIKVRSGPQALAGFGSAKCSNEEAYLFQKLVRAVFGTNNVDHCTRLCHASSVAALLETIGSGAVTNVFADIRRAEVALLAGTNTTANHPVAATFFKEAAKKGVKLIVIDPRRPDIADHAHRYIRIKPGTDVAFYNSMMNVVIQEGLVDQEFINDRTDGFDGLAELVKNYAPEQAAKICGVRANEIVEAARTFGRASSAMIFWGMGISQHTTGTDNARCLISLCLMTGNVGRPGTGLHPLRGQNNVQGASDAGLIPMVYPDYQSVAVEQTRAKFEKAWNVSLDPKPGLTVVEIMAGALNGSIRGMYMMGENPFISDPNSNKVRKALANLEFLAVQDIFLTETAEFADVIFPAKSFLEKLGTYTNTDRRVQVGRPVLEPPTGARDDWAITAEIGRRMGRPMDYESPKEIFDEFANLTENYRGLTYDNLGDQGKLWPCPDPEQADGTEILFGESFPSGAGKFSPAEFAPAKELPDEEYPFVLNTGRLLEHWHTGSMTRRSVALDAIAPEAFVEINPEDMVRLGLATNDFARVTSRRGTITLKARSAHSVAQGSAFIPFHFREASANLLTTDELDPYGKIPEFKFCAIRIEVAPAG